MNLQDTVRHISTKFHKTTGHKHTGADGDAAVIPAGAFAFTNTVTGLTWTNATSTLSLTAGYVIPTTTEETNWNNAYALSHARAHGLLTVADHSDVATYLDQAVLTTSDVKHLTMRSDRTDYTGNYMKLGWNDGLGTSFQKSILFRGNENGQFEIWGGGPTMDAPTYIRNGAFHVYGYDSAQPTLNGAIIFKMGGSSVVGSKQHIMFNKADGATQVMDLDSDGVMTLPSYSIAGVLHNAVTTGIITSSLIVNDDITTATIAYAKIQNVANTSRVLGRISAGAGVIEELTAANLKTICSYYTSGDSPTFGNYIKILEGGGTPIKYTTIQGGDQTIDLTYTLPTAYPAANDYALVSSTAGVWEWKSIPSLETDPVFNAWLLATPPLYAETDPVYSANTYAVGMNQGVATTDSPTFQSISGQDISIYAVYVKVDATHQHAINPNASAPVGTTAIYLPLQPTATGKLLTSDTSGNWSWTNSASSLSVSDAHGITLTSDSADIRLGAANDVVLSRKTIDSVVGLELANRVSITGALYMGGTINADNGIDTHGAAIGCGTLTVGAFNLTVDTNVLYVDATNNTVGFGCTPGTTSGYLYIGDADTNLYRSAANTLKTDDSFIAGSGLTVNGTAPLFDNSAVTGSLYVNVKTSNADYGGYLFSDTDANYRGGMFYNHATDVLSFNAAGAAAFNYTSSVLNVIGNLGLIADTYKALFGAGTDMSIWYDGTYGQIKTSDVTASDLRITCGANKTLELQNPVYEDLQFPLASGKVPASNYPTWETFTTNTMCYAFSVDDYIDLQAGELPHNWVEGTAGDLHMHFTIKTAQSTGANRYAKFSIWIAYADTNEAWVEQAVLTYEATIPTGSAALTNFYLDMGDATLTNYLVGGQVKMRVKRIAATGGTEYADDVYITQVGMHLQRNTIGSRTELTK